MTTFEQELTALIEEAQADGTPQEQIERMVADFFRHHGREVPPPINGTIEPIEIEDKLW